MARSKILFLQNLLLFSTSFILVTSSLPANDGSFKLSRREVQGSDGPAPSFDAKGYPEGFWEIDIYHDWTYLKDDAPRYPFKESSGDAEPMPLESKVKVDKLNYYINRCWIYWLEERRRQKFVRKVPEWALQDQDAYEARKCTDRFRTGDYQVDSWLKKAPFRFWREDGLNNPIYQDERDQSSNFAKTTSQAIKNHIHLPDFDAVLRAINNHRNQQTRGSLVSPHGLLPAFTAP